MDSILVLYTFQGMSMVKLKKYNIPELASIEKISFGAALFTMVIVGVSEPSGSEKTTCLRFPVSLHVCVVVPGAVIVGLFAAR